MHHNDPSTGTFTLVGDELDLSLETGEVWWGGAVDDGGSMPFGAKPFTRDLAPLPGTVERPPSNQAGPLLLSSTGRVVWSERPFAFTVEPGRLRVSGRDLLLGRGGQNLREAYLAAAQRFFPASGRTPARELFTAPQYNTWIELPWAPTQDGVLAHVRALLDAGLPPGVVMIDDNWAPDHGTLVFDPARFPDPAAMVEQLHAWGCPVMLWVVPFVTPDSATFRDLQDRGLLLRDAAGEVAVRRWWNGFSAVLDLSNPDAVGWFTGRLDALRATTGVDGFKFDGGDARDFRLDDRTAEPAEPVDLTERWARVGLGFSFNEFRACWRQGGQPLAQRLQDKPPSWGSDGLGSLVPELVAQGLLGYAFSCPDMVGGGEIGAVTGEVDQEFFVRYAQIACLAPMVQFSVSPARVLDAEHLAAVHAALALRAELLPLLLGLVQAAATTGEPVVRAMAYHEPGTEHVSDQFLLGPDLLVAPVLERGATHRDVVLPAGHWRGPDGTLFQGPAQVRVVCDLRTVPRFARVAP
ncbi:glycoside hydrolase family 31 protein [Kineococcus sp. SYSU DK003]|uniref:glycoside hydrolase family 31 protein n=1 Tax=Kineococcus sp. SYSU DK003 TaxID=3383124 RepID=UPI003D7DEB1C